MIERVARAIALSDGGTMVGNSQSKATREFGWDGSNTNAMNKYVEAHWLQFKHAAIFAIGAMREPTTEMYEAGQNEVSHFDGEFGDYNVYFSAQQIDRLWPAMIDAALKGRRDTMSPNPYTQEGGSR